MTTAGISSGPSPSLTQPPEPTADRTGLNPAVLAATLALLTFAAYLPALGDGFSCEDAYYVPDNVNLRSLEGLNDIWLQPRTSPQYYPLVFTSFWLEYH